jgi:hypothetical protein
MGDMLHSVHGSTPVVLMLNPLLYFSLAGASRLSRVDLGGGDSFLHICLLQYFSERLCRDFATPSITTVTAPSALVIAQYSRKDV